MTSTTFPLTFPIWFDDAFDNAFERLKDRLTTPYYTDPDGDIDKLMQMQAEQVEGELHAIDDVTAAHKLAEATGYGLDQWGVLVGLPRETSETDDVYRARMYVQIATYRRSATPQDMVSTCADILGVATNRVTFVDGALPSSFQLKAFLTDIEAAGLTLSDFSNTMDVAKAAGVDMTLAAIGTFAHRGIGDPDDNTKGYNNIANANPDGGVYSGLI